jgi:hypothetical protein
MAHLALVSLSRLISTSVVCSSTVFPKRFTPSFVLISFFLCLSASAQSSNSTGSTKPNSTSSREAAPPPKGVHDVISTTFSATCGDPDDSTKALDLVAIQPQLDLLAKEKAMDWTGSELYKIARRALPGISDKADNNQAYIFHVNHWTTTSTLVSSDWFVYRATKDGKLKPSGYTATGDQSLYGLRSALIVGIEIINGGKSGSLEFDYKVSALQGTPENSQALGQLISALLGFATPSSKQFVQTIGCSVLTGAAVQIGTKHLPYELDVAESAYDPNKMNDDKSGGPKNATQSTSPGVADCSSIEKGSACSLARTFTSLDKEWWDVGIGVTIPGVRETKYTIVNNSLKGTSTTHTNAYALFDLYPFAKVVTKDSGIPHFAVGLPLTGQTFYRPFFGMSENLTGWNGFQQWSGLPSLNFFAGIVYMKTSVVTGSPANPAELTTDQHSVRVVKALFGVEVSVKSLINKVGKPKNSSGADASEGSKQSSQNGNN